MKLPTINPVIRSDESMFIWSGPLVVVPLAIGDRRTRLYRGVTIRNAFGGRARLFGLVLFGYGLVLFVCSQAG